MKKYEPERTEKATDEEFALGCKVRALRDEGTPWWAIAKDLEMEGAGESATTGKKGAARARQAYAKAFGSHPRTNRVKSDIGKEKNEHVVKMKSTKQADRIKKVKKGKSLFKKKMTDEEVAEMLAKRKISWLVQPEGLEPTSDHAQVHPQGIEVYYEPNGDRAVKFHEVERASSNTHGFGVRGNRGRFRCVRLSRIYSVR